jgi:hypothetical protein
MDWDCWRSLDEGDGPEHRIKKGRRETGDFKHDQRQTPGLGKMWTKQVYMFGVEHSRECGKKLDTKYNHDVRL